MPRLAIGLLLLGLTACQRTPEAAGPGADQSTGVDNAAEVLDASPDGLTAPAGGNMSGNISELDN